MTCRMASDMLVSRRHYRFSLLNYLLHPKVAVLILIMAELSFSDCLRLTVFCFFGFPPFSSLLDLA